MMQATVKIEVNGGPIIYIDPTDPNLQVADADLILLTHNHSDHQSVPVLNRLRKPGTVFVSSPPGVPALQQNFSGATIHAVTPGARLTVAGVEIETVPMYNIVKANHPRAMNFVGFVVNIGGVRVYHAGDTERIPEMRTFSTDVALLPLGQRFTMNTVQEAVDAAIDVKARIAVPIHWGNAEGTRDDAEFFVNQLTGRMQAMVNTPPGGLRLEISETVAIAAQPDSETIAPGGTASLRVQATGAAPLRYQWRRNGVALPGATAASLPIAAATTAHAGDYDVVITDANGPLTSRMARVLVETPRPGRLVNVSVRGVTAGGAPLIVGCVVDGPKQLLIRGVGPSLANFGVANAIPGPAIELHRAVGAADQLVTRNQDWRMGDMAMMRGVFGAVGAFPFSETSADAALLATVDGARTVHVYDAGNRTGVALVEVYDAQPGGQARLLNLSARNFAGTGEDALIAGFVISGNVPKRLLLRGVGPQLQASFGISGALSDPKLELYLSEGGRNVLFATNDDWAEGGGGATSARAAFTSAGAFNLPDATSKDAALVVMAPAGAFTVQVSGVGNATGAALVEVYELP